MLIDVNPGPSSGDAADYIERLGFDPWSFGGLKLVDEVTAGRWIVATFSVTGTVAALAQLCAAHQEFSGHPRRAVSCQICNPIC